MTFKETILQEALDLFHKEGIHHLNDTELFQRLDISAATFREMFDSKQDLVRQMAQFDIDDQAKRNEAISKRASNAIENILLRIETGIKSLRETNPVFYMDLMQHYPDSWELYMNNLETNSKLETAEIINQGVVEGNFRKDLNIQLVTKIMLEQINMLINPQIFPPDRYNLSEVFRSIFLYYIRGICTETGAKMTDEHFAKVNVA